MEGPLAKFWPKLGKHPKFGGTEKLNAHYCFKAMGPVNMTFMQVSKFPPQKLKCVACTAVLQGDFLIKKNIPFLTWVR